MALDDILKGLEDQKKRIESNLAKLKDKPAIKTPEVIPTYQQEPESKPQGKIEAKKEIDIIDRPFKVSLSVPLIATYLKRGVKQSEIADICGTSKQAVNQYIDRHSDELAPLIDKDDGFIATKAKYIHDKAMNKLIDCIDLATQKDMIALNMVSGTHFDKYRLSTNQSTTNISIAGRFMMLQEQAEDGKD